MRLCEDIFILEKEKHPPDELQAVSIILIFKKYMFAIQNTEDSWQQDQDNISDTEYKQEVLTGRRGTREMPGSV